MSKKILFLDRDGTLIEEPDDYQIDTLSKLRLTTDVIPVLLKLAGYGYRFVMVSNQDGLGTPSFPQAAFDRVQAQVIALFSSQGIHFDEVFICPHLPDAGCDCRKPRAGLLTRYLAGNTIDLQASAVIGDRQTDLELAEAIGMRGLLFAINGSFQQSWQGLCQTLRPSSRTSTVHRQTKETDVRILVNLDESGPTKVSTGIGFYDHMLEQISRHGGFRLELACEGDLHIDEHHTIEDTALALGQALRQALGDKRGIARYGFVLPMDESEAQVSLDLSGRPFLVFRGKIPGERVGGMPTELVQHFFHSLADSLGAALHIDVRGSNAHHMTEICFKGVGRTLRDAIRRDGDELPSTKGML